MLKPYKITIAPFIVESTSKQRLEQEIADFLEHELMVSEPPDDGATKVTIEEV